MRQFNLVTTWQLESAIDRVWDAIVTVEKWPRWWRFVRAVEELEKGDADGLGRCATTPGRASCRTGLLSRCA